MPYEKHEVVVVTSVGSQSRDAILAFRKAMPLNLQQFLVGPTIGANFYYSFAMMPDGGGEGAGGLSDEMDYWRREFLTLVPGLVGSWIHVQMTEESGRYKDAEDKWHDFVPCVLAYGHGTGDSLDNLAIQHEV
jgi:hypothetical protein